MAQQKTSIAAYLSELEPDLLTTERFAWWAMAVFDFCEELGLDDDPDLPEMQKLLCDYYRRRESEADVRQMRETIRRLRGDGFLQDDSLLGIKFRCLYAVASPIEEIAGNRERWRRVGGRWDDIGDGEEGERFGQEKEGSTGVFSLSKSTLDMR